MNSLLHVDCAWSNDRYGMLTVHDQMMTDTACWLCMIKLMMTDTAWWLCMIKLMMTDTACWLCMVKLMMTDTACWLCMIKLMMTLTDTACRLCMIKWWQIHHVDCAWSDDDRYSFKTSHRPKTQAANFSSLLHTGSEDSLVVKQYLWLKGWGFDPQWIFSFFFRVNFQCRLLLPYFVPPVVCKRSQLCPVPGQLSGKAVLVIERLGVWSPVDFFFLFQGQLSVPTLTSLFHSTSSV